MKDMPELPIELKRSRERTSSLSPSGKKPCRCVLTTHTELHDLKSLLSFSHETPHKLDSLSDMHPSSHCSLDMLTREQASCFKRASGMLDRITGLLQQLVDIKLQKQCSPAKNQTVDALVTPTVIQSETPKAHLAPACTSPIQRAKQTVLSVLRPTPHDCQPELSLAHKLINVSKEMGTLVLYEPTQTEPLVASTLSVEDMFILTDTQPEALEASPMPKRETVVKCTSPMSGSIAACPCSKSALAVPSSEQPPFMLRSLITSTTSSSR